MSDARIHSSEPYNRYPRRMRDYNTLWNVREVTGVAIRVNQVSTPGRPSLMISRNRSEERWHTGSGRRMG